MERVGGHTFGLRGDVAGNVGILNDGRVVYPVGSNIVLHKRGSETSPSGESGSSQAFVVREASSQGGGITAMAAPLTGDSPKRSERLIAVAERGSPPVVYVYDLSYTHKGKKPRVFVGNNIESDSFVWVAFDAAQKAMITLSGAPDFVLSYWQLDKPSAPPRASVPVTTTGSETATMASFHPTKSDMVVVSGANLVKMFKLHKEGSFRNMGPSLGSGPTKVELGKYLCHAWLNDETLVLGTELGKIAAVVNSELVTASLPCSPYHKMEAVPIFSIVPFSKGFVIGTEGGRIVIYEAEAPSSGSELVSRGFSDVASLELPSHKAVNHMVIGGPSDSDLVVTTTASQLYILPEFSTYLVRDELAFVPVSASFHASVITGLDTCVRKPLVATCSPDRSVRIWNYMSKTLVVAAHFNEEAHSVALHPSGHMLLVGFSDKLRLMNVLVDSLETVHEFPVCRSCKEVRFSHGGQYFAAARENNFIHLYNTYTFECFAVLSGHDGRVRSIQWTPDDCHILSAGQDGAIYKWDFVGETVRGEVHVRKICSYSSAALAPNGNLVYAAGSDRLLKEITVDGREVHELDTGGTTYTNVLVAPSNRMMFVGTEDGTVRALKYPSPTGEYHEVAFHAEGVTRMALSFDERWLFSAGADGSLFVAEVHDSGALGSALGSGGAGSGPSSAVESGLGTGVVGLGLGGGGGRGLAGTAPEMQLDFATEVLVTPDMLKAKDDAYAQLQHTLKTERTTWEFHVRNMKEERNNMEKELHLKYQHTNDELREITFAMRLEKDQQMQHYEEQIHILKENFRRELEKVRKEQGDIALASHRKYEQLEAQMHRQAELFEKEKERLQQDLQEASLDLQARHQAAMQEKEEALAKLEQKMKQRELEYMETRRQIEEDADQEIQERIQFFKDQIDDRDNRILKLKGLVGVMRKEFTQLNKAIDDQHVKTQQAEDRANANRTETESAKKQIDDLQKEIDERNDTIKDKENRIHELKKKNQELEKFKFVLEYKNKELNKQLEPRDAQINEQIKQINQMDAELEKYYKNNITLKLTVENLELKVKALEKEISHMRSRLTDAHAVTKRFRTDLHETVQFIQDPKKLKERVKKLYQKHVTLHVEEARVDVDIQRENNRQREYLERSVASLKRKLNKDAQLHRADSARVMQENVALIKEINELRREIKQLRAHNRSVRSFGASHHPYGASFAGTDNGPPPSASASSLGASTPAARSRATAADAAGRRKLRRGMSPGSLTARKQQQMHAHPPHSSAGSAAAAAEPVTGLPPVAPRSQQSVRSSWSRGSNQ
ncbi:WD repeat domain 65 [Thecamonas trahens ATCC 50062]|uniref:WD repeat domain 65 n=1 Tax=Thecamonas trahens ATCC 50062 TaxID=461836 RepID=A0A0L0DDL5_THETB|nr:WD repeat domain 65 [Thecamonas trahens ATCC 50062]KNC50206.1 WD repeat domain 65 [Thecamonas trahens ATCC 50062]|eukprot:XP_013757041.1 WD repeat domain 65 [Thecamonas trahens ATCC 50062]